MQLTPSELWNAWVVDCPRCNAKGIARRPWEDFVHDLRCWSLRTALYNQWERVRAAFGG